MKAKITDEQIFKALECCAKEEDGNCAIRGCPLHKHCEKDIHTLEKSALDLIKRQEAEIENLKMQFSYLDNECSRLEKETEEQMAEIERLNANYEKLQLKYENAVNDNKFLKRKNKKAESEAIKEFAERVQEEIADSLHSTYKARGEKAQEIPIYTESEFLSYCSGKIDCLLGLGDFIDNLVKELEAVKELNEREDVSDGTES